MPAFALTLLETPTSSGDQKFVQELADGQRFVIGRSVKADFPVDDPNISRQHLVLQVIGGQLYAEDISRNGTYLNDAMTPIGGRIPLSDDDVLRLGESRLQVRRQRGEPIRDGELVGQEINGFRFEKVIGSGEMSVVYAATQLSINRPVAIKTLSSRHVDNHKTIQRFLKVANIAGQLSHPNIVAVYGSGAVEDRGLYYLAMELVEGETLAAKLEREGKLDQPEALGIVEQIGSALAFGHRKNVVHRDVMPENIIVSHSGMAKLIGLGLAKSLEPEEGTELTMAGASMGELKYSAPEQVVDASSVTRKADIWSLGAVSYEMLTGQTPLDPRDKRAYFDALAEHTLPPAPHELESSIEVGVSEAVMGCLQFEIAARYDRIDELLDALHAVQRSKTVTFSIDRMHKARLQLMAMLPDRPQIPGYRFATLFSPSEAVGGDFYEFFRIDEARLGIVLGDVAGHGLEAALLVGMAKSLSRVFGRQKPQPTTALRLLNSELLPDLDAATFMTCCMGVLDIPNKTFTFARGGHNPVILWNPERPEPLMRFEPPSVVIGMVKDRFFKQTEETLQLRSGDLMLMYTDGIVEAMNAEEELFEVERLDALIRTYQPGDDLDALLNKCFEAMVEFAGTTVQEDDVTLMALYVE